MNWNDFWTSIGIKVPDLMAGLAGGLVNAFVFKKSNPMAIIGSIIVGALTANYLSEIATRYVGTSPGASAFIVGLSGMAVCQSIAEAVSKWRPSSPKGDSQ
jgi:uncharacterized membrane protein YeaQ/YmgE (transglycosylase-associated protein family)